MRLIRDLNPESQKMLERIYRASKHHQVRERAKCILLSFQVTVQGGRRTIAKKGHQNLIN
jgi:hypothetical protein